MAASSLNSSGGQSQQTDEIIFETKGTVNYAVPPSLPGGRLTKLSVFYLEEDKWNFTACTYNDTALRVKWSVPTEYDASNTTIKIVASLLDDRASVRRRRARDVPALKLRATEEQATLGGLQPYTVYIIGLTVLHPNGTELYSREVYGVSDETCKLTIVQYSRLSFNLVS